MAASCFAGVAMLVLICCSSQASAQTPTQPQCKRFDEIYTDGKDLCETIFGQAFKYETNEAAAYTMWFFDASNPNDQTARSLGKLGAPPHSTCGLHYYHLAAPVPETSNFTECTPWKDSACCAHSTVASPTVINAAYGSDFAWDRCGPLSQACERFFVQESCLYECDANAGLYRKYNSTVYDPRCDADADAYNATYSTANNCSQNKWEMYKMPIKASYCNAWYTACHADKFCADADGDFFSCAQEYEKFDAAAAAQAALNQTLGQMAALQTAYQFLNISYIDAVQNQNTLSTGALIGIIVPTVLAAGACLCAGFLIRREKMGKPLFDRLADNYHNDGPTQSYGHSQA